MICIYIISLQILRTKPQKKCILIFMFHFRCTKEKAELGLCELPKSAPQTCKL